MCYFGFNNKKYKERPTGREFKAILKIISVEKEKSSTCGLPKKN